MPCFERVVVEVDFVIREHSALDAAVKARGGRFLNEKRTQFTVGGVSFEIENQKIRATSTATAGRAEIENIVDGLRQQYGRETIKQWAEKQRASVTERADGTIVVRKWVQ